MPLRPFTRDQRWLLPPSLEELVPEDHPARFVATFVEALSMEGWAEVELEGDPLGRPAYDPRALLCIWLYGFMTGVRSCRKLEMACCDQIPYLWLSGMQRPDHNTLSRFYQAHRKAMRKLFKRTVKTAMALGLVDLALQAIDGTRIAGNASRERTYDQQDLEKVLKRTEAAIEELEAQNRSGGQEAPARLPEKLRRAEKLKQQVQAALGRIEAEEGVESVNLTDPEAGLVKGRQGIVAGYNAQAAVSPLKEEVAQGTGRLITATEVVAESYDYDETLPMLKEAEATLGQRAEVSLLDGGYHSGPNLRECAEQGYRVLMAESQDTVLGNPYHKDQFVYEAESDSYLCPMGQKLPFRYISRRKKRPETRVYRAARGVCRSCSAFGVCTKGKGLGRAVEIGPYDEELRRNRARMATEEGKAIYARRKELPEPVFGILKELQGARRFLLRGLEGVRAEWALLAATFNLRTLFGVWRRRQEAQRVGFFRLASA